MTKTVGVGTSRPVPTISSPTAAPAAPPAPEPAQTPPPADAFDAGSTTAQGSSSTGSLSTGASGSSSVTHGSMLDKARTFALLFDKVPQAVGKDVSQMFESASATLKATRALSDQQLAQLPAAQLADMADHLVSSHSVADLFSAASASDRTTQLARILSAKGSQPGAADSILAMMSSAKQIPAQAAGPDRARVLALTDTPPAKPGDWSGFESYVDAATGTTQRPGTSVEPLIDGSQAFPEMYAAIDSAKSSIDLSMYAFHSDNTGWDYAKHLAAAADRGVAVRVLVDPFGSSSTGSGPTDPALIGFLKQHGVQLISRTPGALGDDLTHRKILVVDGTTGFTGGMNIGDDYSKNWHDAHARVTGTGVADLQQAFVTQWQSQGGQLDPNAQKALFPTLAPAGTSSARVVAHQGDQDQSMKLTYLRAIDTASKSIHIANPYLSDPDVLQHLISAARRGVEVSLVLPAVNDSGPEQEIERTWYNSLTQAGAHIYEYPDKMAHEKVATFDGTVATIGSSNLDARSLVSNDECNVWSPDPKVAQDIDQRLFAHDESISTPVTQYKPGLFRSMWDDTLRSLQGQL